MDTPEKLILLGVGGVIGGLLGVVGSMLHFFPDYKVKKNRIVSTVMFVVGAALIIVGIVMNEAA